MSIEFEDQTGKYLSPKDFNDAIAVVKKFIVQGITKLPPELAVEMPAILRCLTQGETLTRILLPRLLELETNAKKNDARIAELEADVKRLESLEPVLDEFDGQLIETNRDGFCKECGVPYAEGEVVYWLGPGNGAMCRKCRTKTMP